MAFSIRNTLVAAGLAIVCLGSSTKAAPPVDETAAIDPVAANPEGPMDPVFRVFRGIPTVMGSESDDRTFRNKRSPQPIQGIDQGGYYNTGSSCQQQYEHCMDNSNTMIIPILNIFNRRHCLNLYKFCSQNIEIFGGRLLPPSREALVNM